MKLIFSSGKQLFFHSPSKQLSYHRSFFNLLLSVGDTTRRSCIAFAAAVGRPPRPPAAPPLVRSFPSAVRGLSSAADEPPPSLPRPLCPPIANPTVSQRVRGGWKKSFSRLITSCGKLSSFESFLGRHFEHRSLMSVVLLFIHKVYVRSSEISGPVRS